MARTRDKERAIQLRRKGMSYSQIKAELGVSKSTLSMWLRDMPLSKDRLDALQRNENVIEKIRTTKQKKKDERLELVFKNVSKKVGRLSKREQFIAGLFLYWGEGGKTTPYSLSLSNTDPSMVRFFIEWLGALGVPMEKITIRLHLYTDMDIATELKYWKQELSLPSANFRKPYIKSSKFSDLTYRSRGHGTCNVITNGRDVTEHIRMGLRYLEEKY